MRPELDERDIARELARRASGEWHQERVMPAVRRSMANVRAERVVAGRRWAALAGLVGLLGALVVLAVALPRLDLGPAAESPTVRADGQTPGAEPAGVIITCRPYTVPSPEASRRPGDPPLDIQLHDQTGTAVDCAYFSEFATLPEGPPVRTRWHQASELGLTWNVARVCPSSARVELAGDGERHVVTVEPGEMEDCGAARGRQAVVIWFDGPAERPVDASLVDDDPLGPSSRWLNVAGAV